MTQKSWFCHVWSWPTLCSTVSCHHHAHTNKPSPRPTFCLYRSSNIVLSRSTSPEIRRGTAQMCSGDADVFCCIGTCGCRALSNRPVDGVSWSDFSLRRGKLYSWPLPRRRAAQPCQSWLGAHTACRVQRPRSTTSPSASTGPRRNVEPLRAPRAPDGRRPNTVGATPPTGAT